MLPDRVLKRLVAIGKLSQQGKRVKDLFRLMKHPALWLQAYADLHANRGATTRGVDAVTLDGFSMARVGNLIALLTQGRYRLKPSRRVYIPKASGTKTRPLGIPSGDDKLVQEVVRLLLERIHEPAFSADSHGFRRGRSCHTALESIRHTWTGVKWLVEVDVQSFFDTIDHDILIRLLEKKIDDRRFIKLIKAMLKAGYVEQWTYHRTYSGTPQGGVISPLLANIYLHELDGFMAEMQHRFNRGKRRARHPAYDRLVLLTACVASHPGVHRAGTVRPATDRLLTRGDIQVAQTHLRDFGFDPGPIDGRYTAQTQAAVRAFQATYGLPATGLLEYTTRLS